MCKTININGKGALLKEISVNKDINENNNDKSIN